MSAIVVTDTECCRAFLPNTNDGMRVVCPIRRKATPLASRTTLEAPDPDPDAWEAGRRLCEELDALVVQRRRGELSEAAFRHALHTLGAQTSVVVLYAATQLLARAIEVAEYNVPPVA